MGWFEICFTRGGMRTGEERESKRLCSDQKKADRRSYDKNREMGKSENINRLLLKTSRRRFECSGCKPSSPCVGIRRRDGERILPKGKEPGEAKGKRPGFFSLFLSLPSCGLDGSLLFTPLPCANQTDLMAIPAFLKNVTGREFLPVPHLIWRQDAAAAAERADAVEGGEDG
jgi:hypothetical protein